MIFELEIKRSDAHYEWVLVRFPDKIGEGATHDLASALLEPVRQRLVQASDRLSVTVGSIGVGIYGVSEIGDAPEDIAGDIVAILES